ncbi:MAG: gamma-glutamyl-gamma-aminobutyrate hydrolase family protein [Chthoniobacterales bacterium]|nr:gamma-glutamyl-gamma-aminobutyrate hydrolase family protein [Chthoniobacterales bacterium]
MPNLATWMRAKDVKWFRQPFSKHPRVRIWNAPTQDVPLARMDALLLTGGADIAPEFLHQEVPGKSGLDPDADAVRDRWEFDATKHALARGIPIFAICKGLQVLNVALGGTLRLDVPGHDGPEMKYEDVQQLRTDQSASHRLDRVNSSHHQAIDCLGDGCEIEAWCAADEIIEQMRVKHHRFALAVQYHPERGGDIYAPLFADFVSQMEK